LGENIIIFGILHCIGISIILAYPLIKYRYANLIIGVICITCGIYLSQFTFDFNWLLWLGFRPHDLYSFDYVPLLPWFGLIALGLYIGNTLHHYDHKWNVLKQGNSFIPWGAKIFCYI